MGGSARIRYPERMRRRDPTHFDLVHRRDLTFALLDTTKAWRERAVHEFVLRDVDHVYASTAYQIRLPLELVRDYAPDVSRGDLVRLLLPFTVRPNHLLFNVDFTGAKGQSTALLLRTDIAELQAQYIAHVHGRPLADEPVGGALWKGVSAYTTFAWWEHLGRSKPSLLQRLRQGFEESWRTQALVEYLNADLGLDIDADHVIGWLRRVEETRATLVEALGEGEDPDSATECILLAIPFMEFKPERIGDIDLLLDEFCESVMAMNPRTRQVIAEYGRRWEVILETVVPVGQACTIKLSEQRPWVGTSSSILKTAARLVGTNRRIPMLYRALRVMEQAVVVGDARTAHVEIRAADHSVVIDRPRVRIVDLPLISNVTGGQIDFAIADEIRVTPDAIAVYTSDDDRPYFAQILVRARIRWVHRLLVLVLFGLTAAAGCVALGLPEGPDLVGSLALLTFPPTLAGAVVLGREATSLAERLLRPWRISLLGAIGGLWIVTLIRLLT